MLSDLKFNRENNLTDRTYTPISKNYSNKNGYQSYISNRKIIKSSPENHSNEIYLSPNISPHQIGVGTPTLKNHKSNDSSIQCEVQMPGGIKYVAQNEINKKQNTGLSSTLSKGKLSGSPKYEPYTNSKLKKSDSISDISSNLESPENTDSSDDESETFSRLSSKKEKKREKRKQERYQEKMIMKMLMDDYLERKTKEKENLNKSTSINQVTATKGFEIPKNEISNKKEKIPNYDLYSEIDKEKIKEKFRNNYNMLIAKYPKWKIEIPDFNLLPLRLIHERYENVVKTICIYQTAMKWKVYIIIVIAGIEYYGYNCKGYNFLKGLLKAQIKTIHKYDTYLVEFSEQFYSEDESGEDYPLWMRFLGTFASGLASFSSINGAAKMLGGNVAPPDFVFEQADKFVSPPEGTAKLHSDGISDVPEPPTGFQDPNSIMNMIGTLFSTFTGQNTNQPTNNTPQNAVPVKPKDEDDFENADF